jgi:polysaccharide pyruvyl transferase WcaK-like protein
VLANFRRRLSGVELVAFTINPEDTASRHGVAAYPIRRRPPAPARSTTGPATSAGAPTAGARARAILKRTPVLGPILRTLRDAAYVPWTLFQEARFLAAGFRRLRGLSALLICGSGQLNDYVGGPWGYPYTLYKWTLLARLAGVPVMFLSVGAGPISSRLGRLMIRGALRRAEYRSYRDPGALRLIERLGVRGDRVIPDMAYSLDVPEAGARVTGGERRGLRVGCCPLPYCDGAYWHVDDRPAYERYVTALADATEWLARAGHVVELYAMQLKVDPGVLEDVRGRVAARGTLDAAHAPVVHRITSLEQVVGVVSRLDVVIATRYHGAVLAYRMEKPVLAIMYHEKARELVTRMGQLDHAVEIDALTLPLFQERFSALERDRDAVARQIARTLGEIRGEIVAQYDEVVGRLNPGRKNAG